MGRAFKDSNIRKQYGHNVPFSQKRTKKVWSPNLQKKTFILNGKKVTKFLTASELRTLKKQGKLTPIMPKAKQAVSKAAKATKAKATKTKPATKNRTETAKATKTSAKTSAKTTPKTTKSKADAK